MEQHVGKYIVVQDCRATSRRPRLTPHTRPLTYFSDAQTQLEMVKETADQRRGRDVFLVQVVDPKDETKKEKLRLDLADELNAIITDMTDLEVKMARTAHERGVGISDVPEWVCAMSKHSSRLAELYRKLSR
jgi:hypothetical protein